jgi:hypothetical protein
MIQWHHVAYLVTLGDPLHASFVIVLRLMGDDTIHDNAMASCCISSYKLGDPLHVSFVIVLHLMRDINIIACIGRNEKMT